MATFEAIYLKIDDVPNAELFQNLHSFLRKNGLNFGTIVNFRFQEGYSWIQIQNLPWCTDLLEGKDDRFLPEFAALLSDNYQTGIVCLYTQTVVDAVGYWHFENGREERCLVYGFNQEGLWDAVRGQSKIWENALFFDPNRYSDILSEDDELAAQIIELSETKQIKPGSSVPLFSAGKLKIIAENYQLPGFSFATGWSIEKKM